MRNINGKTYFVLTRLAISTIICVLIVGNFGYEIGANPTRITHEGDLIISGTEVLTIENVTYYQTGNILVYDNAKVIIRNSRVFINQQYIQEFRVSFYGNSSLEMQNSTFESQYGFAMNFREDTAGFIEESIIDCGIHITGNANINIANTQVGFTFLGQEGGGTQTTDYARASFINSSIHEVCFGSDFSPIAELKSVKPGHFDNWSLQRDNIVQDLSIELELIDTFVDHWDLRFGGFATVICNNCEIFQFYAHGQSDVTMKNSKVYQIVLVFESGQEIELNHFEKGFISYLEIQDMVSNQSFVFENSEVVEGLMVISKGAKLAIMDSDIIDLRLKRGPSPGDTFIMDSQIGALWLAGGSGVITFDNTTVETVLSPMNAAYHLQGSVVFINDVFNTRNSPWYNSTVSREFSVIVIDPKGSPLPDIELELYSPQNELVWSDATNLEGKATFEIVFDNSNYDDKWTLVILSNNRKIRKIKFFTNTPIIIRFPPGKSIFLNHTEEINKQMLPLANYHISKAENLSV